MQKTTNSPGPGRLQEQLAKFMGTQESIIYAYDLATVPSVLPAFANSKDLLICDEVKGRAQQIMLWIWQKVCWVLCASLMSNLSMLSFVNATGFHMQISCAEAPHAQQSYPFHLLTASWGPLKCCISLIPSLLASNYLQAVNWAIQNGAVLSRAKLQTFKHNDMDDLERVLREQARLDQKRR